MATRTHWPSPARVEEKSRRSFAVSSRQSKLSSGMEIRDGVNGGARSARNFAIFLRALASSRETSAAVFGFLAGLKALSPGFLSSGSVRFDTGRGTGDTRLRPRASCRRVAAQEKISFVPIITKLTSNFLWILSWDNHHRAAAFQPVMHGFRSNSISVCINAVGSPVHPVCRGRESRGRPQTPG